MSCIYYIPEWFSVKEIFPPDLDFLFNTPEIWTYVNMCTLITADLLREKYGPAYVNTYGFSAETQRVYGAHFHRGWRSKYCSTGANLSQHKMGCALDMAFVYVGVEQVREDILADPFCKEYEYITCVEKDVSWLHFDCRPHDKANKGILQVYP